MKEKMNGPRLSGLAEQADQEELIINEATEACMKALSQRNLTVGQITQVTFQVRRRIDLAKYDYSSPEATPLEPQEASAS